PPHSTRASARPQTAANNVDRAREPAARGAAGLTADDGLEPMPRAVNHTAKPARPRFRSPGWEPAARCRRGESSVFVALERLDEGPRSLASPGVENQLL